MTITRKDTRPEFVTDEMLMFLDELRESAIINMFGAAPHLASAYGMSIQEAREALSYWMRSFGERHGAQS